MTLEELLREINFKTLNVKVNNYIITELTTEEETQIIGGVNPTSPILNYERLDDQGFNSKEATNIMVDFNDIAYFNILNFALDQLQMSERLKLETFRDLMHFTNLLRKSEKSVQFIVSNIDRLNPDDCRIFNLLLWFNTYFFNSIILLKEQNDMPSFQIPDGQFLDNRNNYEGLHLARY